MDGCYLILVKAEENQDPSHLSFIGGQPRMPSDSELPHCLLCGAPLTFFLQLAFPNEHIWKNRTLAIFACTSCVNEDHLIPEMFDPPLKGADIPAGFLNSYQVNFRFLVFSTSGSQIRSNYEEKIKFRGIELKYSRNPHKNGNKLGGTPNWILEDESPATYNSNVPMFFLLQLQQDLQFEKVDEAPPQMKLNLYFEPEPSTLPYYELFLGNALYLFGTESEDEHLVYAITQVD